jgi:N,N'-diacetylchitobiose phosphorylase
MELTETRIDARRLSNGRLATLVSGAGGGGTMFGDLAVTRWMPDRTRDADGEWLYVRDVDSGDWWSASAQPSLRGTHAARFHPGLVELRAEHLGIVVQMDVCVASGDDAVLRRIAVRNAGANVRHIELTTYLELVLNTPAADAGHPAFSKLFVQTGFRATSGALVAWRRLRSPGDNPMWVAHLFHTEGGSEPELSYETDRGRFIGRGRSTASPCALDPKSTLSGTVGNVLDPVFALRRVIEIAPGATARAVWVLAAGVDERVEHAALRYADFALVDAAFAAAKQSDEDADELAIAAPDVGGRAPRVPVGQATHFASPRSAGVLEDFNGVGGFDVEADEYVIHLPDARNGAHRPPLPWTNVIANEAAGFLVSESGAGYTWAANSRENRLTPWLNDPVCDPHGEALYLRDDDREEFWSPTPGPAPDDASYTVRHGLGYSHWSHTSRDLVQNVWMFVPREDPVKLVRVRLRNVGTHERRVAVYWYAQWVLGVVPQASGGNVITQRAPGTPVILATNAHRGEFSQRVAFAGARTPHGAITSLTADREAFLGCYGSAEHPRAVSLGGDLDGRVGADIDPCAAFRVSVSLRHGEETEIVFVLGEAGSDQEANSILSRYSVIDDVRAALEDVREFWRELTGRVRIETPAPALDLMVNRWLPYQNLSCRMWGRSAFYQSGGAFGFRDQLQDSSALLYLDPSVTRRQILLHAAHQFAEGDVLHWWHPPTSKGIRTRFADDLLWLPFVTAFYLSSTGDDALLDEEARFVEAPPLSPGEDEEFLTPIASGQSASLYEHCCRSIDRSLAVGVHGLPLMGVGDWNDGMNRVGREGRGESVWMGFFLYWILEDWTALCARRGDAARAGRYRDHRQALGHALNAPNAGWDGAWYRRAYYDDGSPLGSAQSDECQIDVIAQAWAVLSGAAPREQAEQALNAMEQRLVSERDGIIRLLTPAFDRTPHDPGYIKGYLPGVRENGGQYTHGALWAVRALAEMGRTGRAARLLEMLSPVSHTRTPEGVQRYQGEPYVIAADVYGVAPHIGRAGWTWYTGSAGWMYRVALESVLGFSLENGKTIVLCPCIPEEWPGFTVRYTLPDGRTRYALRVSRAPSGAGTSARGFAGEAVQVMNGAVHIPIARDGQEHTIDVALGADVGRRYRERRND